MTIFDEAQAFGNALIVSSASKDEAIDDLELELAAAQARIAKLETDLAACISEPEPEPEPEPQPPVPTGPLYGFSVSSRYPAATYWGNVGHLEGMLGQKINLRAYLDFNDPPPTWATQALAGGRIVSFLYKGDATGTNVIDTWAKTAQGGSDAKIKTLAQQLKPFEPVDVGFHGEPEAYVTQGNSRYGQYYGTPEQFAQAADRFFDVLKGEGLDFEPEVCFMAYNFSSGPFTGQMQRFMPAGFDGRLTADGYNWGGGNGKSFQSVFAPVVKFGRDRGLKIGCRETGTYLTSAGPSAVNTWLNAMASYVDANDDFDRVDYFHHGPEDGHKNPWWVGCTIDNPIASVVDTWKKILA